MAGTTRERLDALLRKARAREGHLALFVCFALVVAGIVTFVLMQRGLAMTHQETVLRCTYDGDGAHEHNADCYDRSGTLVCPLEEREAHVHDDSCYITRRVLVCGQEEGDDHTHSDECYSEEQVLVCGKEEVTEERVPGPGCFVTVTVRDYDGAIVDEDGETDELEATEPVEASFPAQTFEEELRDSSGKVMVKVHVVAPEGAFPQGTTMRAQMVDSAEVEEAVLGAVEREDIGNVYQIQSVDITFFDAEGVEIEPAQQISVALTSDLIAVSDDAYVVRVGDDEAELVSTLTQEELIEHDLTPADDVLVFEAG